MSTALPGGVRFGDAFRGNNPPVSNPSQKGCEMGIIASTRLTAILGAMLLLYVYRLVTRNRSGHRTA